MKKITEHTIFKAVLAVAVLLCTSLLASAQSKLSVDPMTFANHDVVNVPINFSKANPVVGMNFRVVLPEFLEFAGNPVRNDDRFFSSQTTVTFNEKTGKVLVSAFGSQHEIMGNEGVLLFIPVKMKESVTVPARGDLKLTGITFSGAGDGSIGGVAPSWSQQDVSVNVQYLPYEIAFSTDATRLVANAGSKVSVPVNISADCNVVGFQAQISAPEGFEWDEIAVLSNRCPNDGMLAVTPVGGQGNVANLVYISTTNTPISGTKGLVFTLDASVAQTFALESGEIMLNNVQVSYTPTAWTTGTGFKLPFVNGAQAHSRLEALVSDLRTQLADALATIAEQCPDVKYNFTGAAISQAIDALSTEIETLYANGGLNDAEERLNGQGAGISDDINKLVEDAKEAQRNHSNTADYNAAVEQINALQQQLDRTSASVAEQFPGIDIEAEESAAQQAIDKAKADAEAALEAVAAEGKFSYTVPADEITNLINAIPAAAETKRVAANTEAYNNVKAEIEALQQKLNETAESVAAGYPGIDVDTEKNAAQQAIDKAKEDAEAAFNAVAESGFYTYKVPAENINAQIAAINTAAESKRIATNEQAYADAMASVAALQKQLDDMSAKVTADYPGINVDSEKSAAQAAINLAKYDAAAALTAVAHAGFFNYTVPAEEIGNLIQAIETAAETKRVTANEEAYNNVKAEIEALQKKLDDVVTSVASNYPGIDVDTEKTAAQQAIDKAQEDAEAAFNAVAESGFYSYKVPSENINALITAILKAADGKRVEANETAYDESLDLIEALQQKLYAENTRVATEYPGVNVEAEKQTAQEAINTAKSAAEAAYKAVTLTGYYSYEVPVAQITGLIEAIGTAAEVKRVAANTEAYNSALAVIAKLQKALDDMSESMKEDYPGIDMESETAAAQLAIDNAKTAAEAAFAAVAESGFFNYSVPEEEIEKMIGALPVTANEKRMEANEAAYNETLSVIDGLQKELDDMKAEVDRKYPDANAEVVADAMQKAQNAIDEARAGADKAYEDVAEKGIYAYEVDVEAIKALIADIMDVASSGIHTIYMDELPDHVKIFDMNGLQLKQPKPGQVNIIVSKNGEVSKVIVK